MLKTEDTGVAPGVMMAADLTKEISAGHSGFPPGDRRTIPAWIVSYNPVSRRFF